MKWAFPAVACVCLLTVFPAQAQNLTVLQNMSFGSFAPDGSGGTITVDVDGSVIHTGVIDLGGTKSEAQFSATGTPLAAFSLVIPNDPSTLTSGGNTMTLGGFVHYAPATFNGGGSVSFSLGATLTMGSNQPPGTYSATLNMEIVYD